MEAKGKKGKEEQSDGLQMAQKHCDSGEEMNDRPTSPTTGIQPLVQELPVLVMGRAPGARSSLSAPRPK